MEVQCMQKKTVDAQLVNHSYHCVFHRTQGIHSTLVSERVSFNEAIPSETKSSMGNHSASSRRGNKNKVLSRYCQQADAWVLQLLCFFQSRPPERIFGLSSIERGFG